MLWKIIFFLSSSHALQQTLQEPSCTTQGTSRTIRLSVNSTRGPTGVWMDNLSAWTEYSNSSEATQMDIAQTTTECNGKRIIYIHGLTQAPRHEESYDKLKFNAKCGKNAAVLNKGLTVQRINIDEPSNAVVFTNRALMDNEIFEVKIERKSSKFNYGLGIGFMTKTPTDVDILPEMYKSPHAWIYHDVGIYSNNVKVLKTYGKDVYSLQVGDTVGVMRSEMGTVHFFINGEDQGPAISNVPPNLYGIFELRASAEKASIV